MGVSDFSTRFQSHFAAWQALNAAPHAVLTHAPQSPPFPEQASLQAPWPLDAWQRITSETSAPTPGQLFTTHP
jgi:hypothetical protein